MDFDYFRNFQIISVGLIFLWKLFPFDWQSFQVQIRSNLSFFARSIILRIRSYRWLTVRIVLHVLFLSHITCLTIFVFAPFAHLNINFHPTSRISIQITHTIRILLLYLFFWLTSLTAKLSHLLAYTHNSFQTIRLFFWSFSVRWSSPRLDRQNLFWAWFQTGRVGILVLGANFYVYCLFMSFPVSCLFSLSFS